MKKLDVYRVFGLSLLVLFVAASCIKDEEPNIYTKQDELNDISNYIAALTQEGHDVDTTDTDVYYVVIEEGEGDYPTQGDSVVIKYSGFYIDATMFDTSLDDNDDGTYNFRYIDKPMISGFEDGLSIMNKGAKLLLIIPSKLAYGENGGGVMQPYTTLLFEVEMIDIIL